MPDVRSYPGNFTLTLDGVQCGTVKSVAGGGVSAPVVEEPNPNDFYPRKHIGQPQHEDFVLELGFGMAQPVYEWIAASWTGNPKSKSGSVVASDATLRPQSERRFTDAFLTRTTFPALDA